MNASDAYWHLMRNAWAHGEALAAIQDSHDNGTPITAGMVTLWPVHGTSDISDAEWSVRNDQRNRIH